MATLPSTATSDCRVSTWTASASTLVELEPFRAAIAAGVDAIMTAHIAVPALEPENEPATVSSKILTGLLREELGFRGITVTDAMDMQGLSAMFDTAEASVRAIEAGTDVLLMPKRAEDAINGLVAAVQSKRITLRAWTKAWPKC